MSHKRALAAGAKVHASALSVTDPIFAALDAFRSAKAERTAAQQDMQDREEREGRCIIDECPEWARYSAAAHQEQEAKHAICTVRPTTAAGAAAFVRFLAGEMIFDEVTFGYGEEAEDATRHALSNLDHVLTRLAAGAV